MRYLIKQRYFTLRDKFMISDASGVERFEVKGKLISFLKKFSFNTIRGEQIYYVEQKFFSLTPKYVIYQNDNEIATFKARISLFRPKARITTNFGNFKLKGNVFAWDFEVDNADTKQNVMQISKKIFKIADTYTVDINDRNDTFFLCIAAIIDLVYQGRH